MREMRGGCLCGQVRYIATAEPALVAVCHCKNCQKQAGTAFTVVVAIPKAAISIQGRLKTWPIQQRSATGRFLTLKKTSRGVR
jgi:hypothetical protein